MNFYRILTALATALILVACGGENDTAPAAPSPDPIVVTPPPAAVEPEMTFEVISSAENVLPGQRGVLLSLIKVGCESADGEVCSVRKIPGGQCVSLGSGILVQGSLRIVVGGHESSEWMQTVTDGKYCFIPSYPFEVWKKGMFVHVFGDVNPTAPDGKVSVEYSLGTLTEGEPIAVKQTPVTVNVIARPEFAPVRYVDQLTLLYEEEEDGSRFQEISRYYACPETVPECEAVSVRFRTYGLVPDTTVAIYTQVDGSWDLHDRVDVDEWGAIDVEIVLQRQFWSGSPVRIELGGYFFDSAPTVYFEELRFLSNGKDIVPILGQQGSGDCMKC
jgi:hypothetical protein